MQNSENTHFHSGCSNHPTRPKRTMAPPVSMNELASKKDVDSILRRNADSRQSYEERNSSGSFSDDDESESRQSLNSSATSPDVFPRSSDTRDDNSPSSTSRCTSLITWIQNNPVKTALSAAMGLALLGTSGSVLWKATQGSGFAGEASTTALNDLTFPQFSATYSPFSSPRRWDISPKSAIRMDMFENGLLKGEYRSNYLFWSVRTQLGLGAEQQIEGEMEKIALALMMSGKSEEKTCGVKAQQASDKIWEDHLIEVGEEKCALVITRPGDNANEACKIEEIRAERERCKLDKEDPECKKIEERAWGAWRKKEGQCKADAQGAKERYKASLKNAILQGENLGPLLDKFLNKDTFYRFLSGEKCAAGETTYQTARRCLYDFDNPNVKEFARESSVSNARSRRDINDLYVPTEVEKLEHKIWTVRKEKSGKHWKRRLNRLNKNLERERQAEEAQRPQASSLWQRFLKLGV